MSKDRSTADMTKRDFIKKATYVVPAVLTLKAAPAFAAAGSGSNGGKYKKVSKKRYKKAYKSYKKDDN